MSYFEGPFISRVDAVFFDLDDTLHDDQNVLLRVMESMAGDLAAHRAVDARLLHGAYFSAADAYWEHVRRGSDQPLSLGSRRWIWMQTMEAVGIDPHGALSLEARRLFERYCSEYMELFPGALELLLALRERGLKLGVVTNGLSETHRDKIAFLKIESLFDEFFIADEVGAAKPEVRFFAHACEGLRVSPQRAVMVGDNLERDVHGAQGAGLFGVWYAPQGATLPESVPTPDAVVRDFTELRHVLLDT
jgi:HAD superfamily hydrolase (TIGR01549 family)